MYALRRWWDRYGTQTLLTSLALGAALALRQTQGGALLEAYQWLTRPFQGSSVPPERLVNAQVLELQQRLVELESKNQRLETLLGFTQAQKVPGLVAPVIGRSADHWWQQITLGRGAQQGVKEGAIVLSPGGLVGRITQVTANTSRVLLLTDASSRVGVTVSRTRHMGYLSGKAGSRAVLEFFDKVPDVRPGDVITTSALSQLFPPGIPIGRVESVDLGRNPVPQALIELSSPVNHLEWVVVYPNNPGMVPVIPGLSPAQPTPAAKGSAPTAAK